MQLVERQVGEVAAAIRRPVDRRIMQTDQLAILASAHVELKTDPECQASLKSHQRALGRRVHQPPMPNNERSAGLSRTDRGHEPTQKNQTPDPRSTIHGKLLPRFAKIIEAAF